MQFEIFGYLINLYSPVKLKADYYHEGFLLVFKKPYYILKLSKKKMMNSEDPDYDDIPF